jgi:hypothetical protein
MRTSFRATAGVGLLVLMALTGAAADEPIDSALGKSVAGDSTVWYDVLLLGLDGQGWSNTEAPFDRLPANAKGVVPDPVWQLSKDSAGLVVRFVTDAPTIRARWSVRSSRLAMPHMAATGVSGLDLYVNAEGGRWRWLGVGQPKEFPTNSSSLVSGIPAARREYMLYLPLYNGITSLEIGIPKESTLSKAPARGPGRDKPIVFYGTSITQGGCASRPGMVHTAIVGRWLGRPVINLGFSGNGRMEAELATLLAELDPDVYVIDCLPNMTEKEVESRVEPFVRRLRQAHPKTPIVLVEDRTYSNAFLVTSQRQRNTESHRALRAAHERLCAAGVGGLHYLPGDTLLGNDGEDTVDGSHPTDLGFNRMATTFTALLKPLLSE